MTVKKTRRVTRRAWKGPHPRMHPPVITTDLARTVFINAVFNLDDEGFDFIAWGIYQTSKTAGGFRDHEGWARVRAAALKLPAIAAMEQAVPPGTDAEPQPDERVFALTMQTRVSNLTGELRGVILNADNDRHVKMLIDNLREDGWRVEEVK